MSMIMKSDLEVQQISNMTAYQIGHKETVNTVTHHIACVCVYIIPLQCKEILVIRKNIHKLKIQGEQTVVREKEK